MTFWTEIHWHEGMFLRPHHLQAAQRRMETVVRTSMDAARPPMDLPPMMAFFPEAMSAIVLFRTGIASGRPEPIWR